MATTSSPPLSPATPSTPTSSTSFFSPLTNLISLKRNKSQSHHGSSLSQSQTPISSRRSSFSFRSPKTPRLSTNGTAVSPNVNKIAHGNGNTPNINITIPPTPPISAHPSIGEEIQEVLEEQRQEGEQASAKEQQHDFHRDEAALISEVATQTHQSVLLLLQPKTKYDLTHEYPIPVVEQERELLVKVSAVGLNPLDWKAPDYNFAIPTLPYISGRDLVGTVVQAPRDHNSRIKAGDVVLAISTDYRDLRKAAFQQYALSTDFNVCRLPRSIAVHEGAPIGVAFVAAALGLGICFGTDFSSPLPIPSSPSSLSPSAAGSITPPIGPNLTALLHSLPEASIPSDVRTEVLSSIRPSETPAPGTWLAIWGGSSTTALYFTQLAKLAGFRVILVVDVGKHGARLSTRGADLLVDSQDKERAVQIIRAVTGEKLRFGIDCAGRETATKLLEAFGDFGDEEKEDENGEQKEQLRAHLIGLTGLPKIPRKGVIHHTVPIKVFHEVADAGEQLMTWLEVLLARGLVVPPDVSLAEGGLAGVNDALDQMRRGEIAGKRLVVPF